MEELYVFKEFVSGMISRVEVPILKANSAICIKKRHLSASPLCTCDIHRGLFHGTVNSYETNPELRRWSDDRREEYSLAYERFQASVVLMNSQTGKISLELCFWRPTLLCAASMKPGYVAW